MTQKPNDGGPAFPSQPHRMMQVNADGSATPLDFEGMSLRDWFAAMAPKPSRWRVKLEHDRDRARNPHNDSYKPPIRGDMEIEAALRYEFADAMLRARTQGDRT
jgi:hypothetical protein